MLKEPVEIAWRLIPAPVKNQNGIHVLGFQNIDFSAQHSMQFERAFAQH